MAEIKKIKIGTTEYTITDSNAIHGVKSINTNNTAALGTNASEAISGSGTIDLHKVSKTGKFSDMNSRGESFLSWGGQNLSGSYGPIDACMVPDLGANRFAFIPASAWKVEYSRDSGATWADYGASDGQKLALTSEGVALSIGKADSSHKATSAYMLRLTLTTTGVVYSVLNKFLLYISTNGSNGCYVTIQGRTKANLDANSDTWTGFVSEVPISGWSGWNVINVPAGITTHGNSAGHYAQLRFIFGCTSSNTAYNGLQIQKLFAYGGVGWTVPSNMAKNGHMYKYDYNQNVKFPKKLYVNESKEVLATGQTNTFTGTQVFNSGKIYLGQGDNNSLDLGTDGRINSGNSTLVGFVGGTFTLGHSTYNTNIRGKATRPTYNGNDLALKSDIKSSTGNSKSGITVSASLASTPTFTGTAHTHTITEKGHTHTYSRAKALGTKDVVTTVALGVTYADYGISFGITTGTANVVSSIGYDVYTSSETKTGISLANATAGGTVSKPNVSVSVTDPGHTHTI